MDPLSAQSDNALCEPASVFILKTKSSIYFRVLVRYWKFIASSICNHFGRTNPILYAALKSSSKTREFPQISK